MTEIEMRVSDADRSGTLRRLHNAVGLGLIDIDEFEERSVQVSLARQPTELEALVRDLPGPGAIATSAADRLELRGWLGSLRLAALACPKLKTDRATKQHTLPNSRASHVCLQP